MFFKQYEVFLAYLGHKTNFKMRKIHFPHKLSDNFLLVFKGIFPRLQM